MDTGYHVLIPDSSRSMLPELTLPAMDALQQLGHTPVTLAMQSMSEMYRDLRLTKHGGYELFLFYAKDVVQKGNVDFALSFGLSGVMEDVKKGELHYLPEEFELPGLVYMHGRSACAAERLLSAGAANWRFTTVCASSRSLADQLTAAGVSAVRHLPLGYSPRIFYPAAAAPTDAAYSLLSDDERLAQGYDVSFAGSFTTERAALLAPLVTAGVKLAVFGDAAWAGQEGMAGVYRGPVQRLTELNTVYNSSAVNLVLPAAGAAPADQPDYISPRLVECLGSGGFLLALDQPGIAQYAEPGREVALCQPDDLLQAVETWLGDEAGRAAHAAAGLARVQSEAQWTLRLRQALGWLEIATLTAR